jgi:hypothetical protein
MSSKVEDIQSHPNSAFDENGAIKSIAQKEEDASAPRRHHQHYRQSCSRRIAVLLRLYSLPRSITIKP